MAKARGQRVNNENQGETVTATDAVKQPHSTHCWPVLESNLGQLGSPAPGMVLL